MISPLMQAMRSRWFAIGMHVGLWCVLYLAVTHLGGKTPDYRIAETVKYGDFSLRGPPAVWMELA